MADDHETQESSDEAPSVGERFLKLERLFTQWSRSGVPEGVRYPTSMLQLLEWTNEAYGIRHPIGSKRDLNTQSGTHHKIAGKVSSLVKQLKPAAAKQPVKRGYKTQKARRVAAENSLEEYQGLLDDVTKQWAERGAELESTKSLLAYERERAKRLQIEKDALAEENARLKRELLSNGPGLRIVE